MLSEKNLEMRLGRFTASSFSLLMKEARGKEEISKTFESYVWKKIEEIVRGEVDQGYYSKEMQWGHDYEPDAIQYYCEEYGFGGRVPEFIIYGPHSGGTPDFIRDDGVPVQFKCPYTVRSHYEFMDLPLLDPSTHDAYFYQTQWEMVITGTESMQFVSYMPLLPRASRMIVMTLYRDDHAIKRMHEKLEQAIEMKTKILRQLRWQVVSDYLNEEE